MKIVKKGIAGTLESSDVLVTVKPSSKSGIVIDLDSVVKKQFGPQILTVIRETLEKHDVTEGLIELQDKGALDCTICARLEAALFRAAGITMVQWGDKK